MQRVVPSPSMVSVRKGIPPLIHSFELSSGIDRCLMKIINGISRNASITTTKREVPRGC